MMGHVVRLVARARDLRARLLPLDAVDLPALFERGLAYRRDRPAVKWCPDDQTMLANEQVERRAAAGAAARSTKVDLEQWYFASPTTPSACSTTSTTIDWPEHDQARCSATGSGAARAPRSTFALPGAPSTLTVFTTRPDTLFGATYMVLAPEHPLVAAAHAPTTARRRRGLLRTRRAARARSSATRPTKEKTGVFTGAYAHQPRERRADPDLDRRLRADGVRHRRDHGRAGARRARLRLRHAFGLPITVVDRAADRRPGRLGRGATPATASWSTRAIFDGLAAPARRSRDRRVARRARRRAATRSTTGCATG